MSTENYEMYLEHMQMDDFPENMQPIVGKIGMKNVLEAIGVVGGLEIYFPLMKSITSKARDRVILKEYNDGCSFKEIAKRHNMSEGWARQVIKAEQVKNKKVSRERKSS